MGMSLSKLRELVMDMFIFRRKKKNLFSGKDANAGKDWGQEEKGTTEDEMAGWHHRLNRHEFE